MLSGNFLKKIFSKYLIPNFNFLWHAKYFLIRYFVFRNTKEIICQEFIWNGNSRNDKLVLHRHFPQSISKTFIKTKLLIWNEIHITNLSISFCVSLFQTSYCPSNLKSMTRWPIFINSLIKSIKNQVGGYFAIIYRFII